jgi:hypothetical protein
MQSTAMVIMVYIVQTKQKPDATVKQLRAWIKETLDSGKESGFRFGFQHFATTVKTVGADVMTQMHFASSGFNCDAGNGQSIVRTVHTALRRGFFILLDSHNLLLRIVDNVDKAQPSKTTRVRSNPAL